MVSGSLSLRCPRCFSPFPHGTSALSVSRKCLALADGAASFGQGSSGPALLRVRSGRVPRFAYGAFTRCGAPFQAAPATRNESLATALQPRRRRNADGLGWSPFARRYSGSHSCFPFLRLLRCFSSAGSPPLARMPHIVRRVAPFGHLRVNGRPRLSAAFRSLPRPSSPPGAKASPMRPVVLLATRRGSRGLNAAHPLCRVRALSHALTSARKGALLSYRYDSSLTLVLSSFHPFKEPCGAFSAKWRMRDSNPRPPACKAGALAG